MGDVTGVLDNGVKFGTLVLVNANGMQSLALAS